MNPKTIYQISINLNDDLDDLKQSHERLMQLNPGWEYFKITSEHQMIEFMQQHFRDSPNPRDNKIYECYNEVDDLINGLANSVKTDEVIKSGDITRRDELVCISRLVCRTDIFRLATVYKFGGFYFDLSKQLEMNIDKVFDDYEVGFFRCDHEVHNSVLYSRHPRSEYFAKLTDMMIKSFELKRNNLMILAGPGLYTASFGVMPVKHIPHSLHFDDPKINVISTHESHIQQMDIVFKFRAPWKRKLHTPVNGKQINEHWLLYPDKQL